MSCIAGIMVFMTKFTRHKSYDQRPERCYSAARELVLFESGSPGTAIVTGEAADIIFCLPVATEKTQTVNLETPVRS